MTCQDDLLEFREAIEKIEKDGSHKQRIKRMRAKSHKEKSEANPKYP